MVFYFVGCLVVWLLVGCWLVVGCWLFCKKNESIPYSVWICNIIMSICIHCGKSYKKRTSLENHMVLCDLLHSPHVEEEDLVVPSAKKMYQMLIELGKKCQRLEETILASKKETPKNILEWLKEKETPPMVFDHFIMTMVVLPEDANSLLEHSFYDVFHGILSRVFGSFMNEKPIFAQKTYSIYIYQKEGWMLASREKLTWFFNKIHVQLMDVFYSWKKEKLLEIGLKKDSFETACDKAIIKLMTIDFRMESMFSKTRMVLHQLSFS